MKEIILQIEPRELRAIADGGRPLTLQTDELGFPLRITLTTPQRGGGTRGLQP